MSNFDVLIASFNRHETLKNCLASFPTPLPKELNKIYLTILANDVKTKELVKNVFSSYPIEIIENDQILNPGASRNKMIESASADYLCFLDDDLVLPNKYFQNALEIMQDHSPNVFGGPDCSIEDLGDKQDVMNDILASKWVMGPTNRRHKRSLINNIAVDETALTLCNLWIERRVLESSGLRFAGELKRSEENLLLEQILASGFQLKYFSKLYVHHLRRESLFDIARIQFLSGYYRSVCFYKNRKTFKLFFLIPLFAAIFFPLFLWVADAWVIWLFLVLYLIGCYRVVMKSEGWFRRLWGPNLDHLWGILFIAVVHFFFSYGLLLGTLLGWKNAKRT